MASNKNPASRAPVTRSTRYGYVTDQLVLVRVGRTEHHAHIVAKLSAERYIVKWCSNSKTEEIKASAILPGLSSRTRGSRSDDVPTRKKQIKNKTRNHADSVSPSAGPTVYERGPQKKKRKVELHHIKVGGRISIYWKACNKWYTARVTAITIDGVADLLYDEDGMKETINLANERFHIVDESNTRTADISSASATLSSSPPIDTAGLIEKQEKTAHESRVQVDSASKIATNSTKIEATELGNTSNSGVKSPVEVVRRSVSTQVLPHTCNQNFNSLTVLALAAQMRHPGNSHEKHLTARTHPGDAIQKLNNGGVSTTIEVKKTQYEICDVKSPDQKDHRNKTNGTFFDELIAGGIMMPQVLPLNQNSHSVASLPSKALEAEMTGQEKSNKKVKEKTIAVRTRCHFHWSSSEEKMQQLRFSLNQTQNALIQSESKRRLQIKESEEEKRKFRKDLEDTNTSLKRQSDEISVLQNDLREAQKESRRQAMAMKQEAEANMEKALEQKTQRLRLSLNQTQHALIKSESKRHFQIKESTDEKKKLIKDLTDVNASLALELKRKSDKVSDLQNDLCEAQKESSGQAMVMRKETEANMEKNWSMYVSREENLKNRLTCTICCEQYNQGIVAEQNFLVDRRPVIMACCGNSVCLDCAEKDRAIKITELFGGKKFIRCISGCGGTFHSEKHAFTLNRALLDIFDLVGDNIIDTSNLKRVNPCIDECKVASKPANTNIAPPTPVVPVDYFTTYCERLAKDEFVLVRIAAEDRIRHPDEQYFVAKLIERPKKMNRGGRYGTNYYHAGTWIAKVRWCEFQNQDKRGDKWYKLLPPGENNRNEQVMSCISFVRGLNKQISLKYVRGEGQYKLSHVLDSHVIQYGDVIE